MIATLCPDRETLLRYSLGMLPEDEREPLDSHLDGCPDCQAMIVTLDDADDTAIGRLRMPLSGESVLNEPQLQDALAAAMGMPAPVPEASDIPQMLGEYRLIEELGRGGMGRVYKALHTKLDRAVAIKVLPGGRAGDDHATNRFAREMKAVGRFAHPNIVHAYDAREIDGTAVLIMELVDGLDLAEIVRRLQARSTSERGIEARSASERSIEARSASERGNCTHSHARRASIPVPDACELVRQTALALQCAHDHGLVHRDIKPSNIMLARSGEVKLLDLGLARFLAGDCPSFSISKNGTVPLAAALEEMTGTGQAMGTADYMAPEQASDSRTVDIRADIYSLGCTFFKLLTGRAPFSGPEYRTALDKMNAHVKQSAPPIRQIVPEVPEQLAAVLDRMLAKDPAARFATPAEVAEAVLPFCAGADLVALLERAEEGREGQQCEPGSLPSPSGRGAGGEGIAVTRPRRWKNFAGQIVALALVGGLCFALGILITIKKNGKTYQVEAPEGSRTVVDENGNATVHLAGETKNAKEPTNSALDEMKALENGRWKVVRVERGKNVDQSMLSMLGFTGTQKWPESLGYGYLEFSGNLRIFDYTNFRSTEYSFRIDPAETPKTIDLTLLASNSGPHFTDEISTVSGIYEIEGDQMKLCFASYVGAVKPHRPTRFAVEPDSSQLLLVLQRSRSSDDDQAMQGNWNVTSHVENGKSQLTDGPQHLLLWFGVNSFRFTTVPRSVSSRREDMFGMMVLDPEKDAKSITMSATVAEPPNLRRPERHFMFVGIYKLEGDRLTIAYREDGPRPEKLESAPGSGVSLYVLQRVKRDASGGSFVEKSNASGTSPSTGVGGSRGRGGFGGTPYTSSSVRVTQPVVCNVCDYEEYAGRIEKGVVPVTAPAKGKLVFLCGLGGNVREGDTIAVILPENEWAALQPKLAPISERLVAALRQLEKTMPVSPLLAQGEHDEAVQKALKERESAFEEMNSTLRNLKSAKVLAPCSGELSLAGFPSDFDIGTLIGSIKSTDATLVTFDVPESAVLAHRRMPNRKPNWEFSQPVVVALADDKGFPYRGKVVSVADGIDPKTHTQRWQALVPNKDGLFMPGMSVRVRVITSEPRKVMLIPTTGRVNQMFPGEDEHSRKVEIMSDQNVVETRDVTIGQRYDDFVSVTEGLKASDWVVISRQRGGFGGRAGAADAVAPDRVTTPPPPWAAISVPPAVSVARPIAREVSDYADYTGRIDNGAIEVKAPIGGTVKFHFKPGKPIKQGDLLADMLSEADSEKLAKAQQAVDSRIVPQSTQDRKQLAQADEQLKKARAELDEAKRAVKYIKILAPCSGTLRSYFSQFNDEMHVDAGICLLSINSHDPIYAVFDVDERTVIQLRRKMADRLPDWELSRTVLCGLNGDAGFPLRGKVTSVDNEMDPKTGTQCWHALLPNKDGVLVPGMFVRVRLLTGDPHKALLVPERALGSDQGRKFVFVANDQNAAERRDVEVGQLQDDGLRVITKGLSGDDRVILQPSKVTPGMTVTPEDPSPVPARR